MRFVGTAAAHAAFIVFISGLLVRLTLGDSVDRVAALFYATPWPVLALLPLGEAVLWFNRGRRIVATAFLALTLGCTLAWLSGSYFPARSAEAPGHLRVLFWNAQRPKARLPSVIEKIRSANADLIGIAEFQPGKAADHERWKAAFPSYSSHQLAGGMLFLCRGESTLVESGHLAPGSYYHVLKTRTQQADITVVFVDLNGTPHRSRRPDFEQLNEVLAQHAGEDVILIGDFNTPRESVFFTELRRTMRHAFETAGSGLAETWPVPVPALSLDHVWVGGQLQITHCRLGWWFASDHRPVIVDLARNPDLRVNGTRLSNLNCRPRR